MWVQVTAWDEADEVLFKSGHIGEDEALVDSEDENLWRIGDRMYDDQDHEVHMFWDATRVESDLLPAPTAFSPLDPDWIDVHRAREYVVSGAAPARVEIEVKMRPLGFDLLRDLVASGDLEPGYEEKIPTYTLEYSRIRWKAEDGLICTSIPH